MTSYYRINVAKDGHYLFATEQGGILAEVDLKRVLSIICKKFPDNEGYKISCTYWDAVGYQRDINAILNN